MVSSIFSSMFDLLRRQRQAKKNGEKYMHASRFCVADCFSATLSLPFQHLCYVMEGVDRQAINMQRVK